MWWKRPSTNHRKTYHSFHESAAGYLPSLWCSKCTLRLHWRPSRRSAVTTLHFTLLPPTTHLLFIQSSTTLTSTVLSMASLSQGVPTHPLCYLCVQRIIVGNNSRIDSSWHVSTALSRSRLLAGATVTSCWRHEFHYLHNYFSWPRRHQIKPIH